MENCKYYKYQKYISRDNGQTWNPMSEYQKGGLYEICSEDCGYVPSYRWISDGYECDETFPDLYQILKKQYSYDGVNWNDVVPLETKKVLYEMDSLNCGFEKPDMYGLKYYIKRKITADRYGNPIDGETTIFSASCCVEDEYHCTCNRFSGTSEVNYGTSLNNRKTIIIGDCVNEIRGMAVGCNEFNNIILPNSLKIIYDSCFGYTQDLSVSCISKISKINMPDSIQYIGANAFHFTDLSDVRNFNIPNNLRWVGVSAFTTPMFSSIQKKILNKTHICFPNIRVIEGQAFENTIPNTQKIDTIEFGQYLWKIGYNAFNRQNTDTVVDVNKIIYRNILYPTYERNCNSGGNSFYWEPIYDDIHDGHSCSFDVPTFSSGDTYWQFGSSNKYNVGKIYVPKHSKYKFIAHFMEYSTGYTENDYIGRRSNKLGFDLPEVVELDEEPYLPNLPQLGMIYSQYDEWYPIYVNETQTTSVGSYSHLKASMYEMYKPLGIPYGKRLVINEGVDGIYFNGMSETLYYGHDSLEEVVIPSTVTTIGWDSFSPCNKLRTVKVYATTPPEGRGMYYGDFFHQGLITTIYVPDASLDLYLNDRWWNQPTKWTIKPLSELPNS